MSLESDIDIIIASLNRTHGKVLAQHLAILFMYGYKKSGATKPLTNLQLQQIKAVSTEQMGYLAEYNQTLGEQLKAEVKKQLKDGAGYTDLKETMKPYIKEVFGENGKVTIDRTGEVKKLIELGSDGKLREVEHTITKPFTSSTQAYADMLSRTAAHTAMETGRTAGYEARGIKFWKFIGSDDERTRETHRALLDEIFEYGTEQSDFALRVLDEPNCRHRQLSIRGNPDI